MPAAETGESVRGCAGRTGSRSPSENTGEAEIIRLLPGGNGRYKGEESAVSPRKSLKQQENSNVPGGALPFPKLEGQDEEHDGKGTLYHVPHFQKDTDAVCQSQPRQEAENKKYKGKNAKCADQGVFQLDS